MIIREPESSRIYSKCGEITNFCKLRLMYLSKFFGITLTIILIVGGSTMFIVSPGIFFLRHYSGLPLFFCCLSVLLSISSLFKTHLTDPGMIPSRKPPPKKWLYICIKKYLEKKKQDSSDVSNENLMLDSIFNRAKISKSRDPNCILKSNYCATCHIWRPPRASHCSVCSIDVDEFDHHCPWVSNCIGRRNYKYFFIFVWSTIILVIYSAIFSLLHLSLTQKFVNNIPAAMEKTATAIKTDNNLYSSSSTYNTNNINDTSTNIYSDDFGLSHNVSVSINAGCIISVFSYDHPSETNSILNAISSTPVSFALLLYCIIIGALMTNLGIYHCYLQRKGLTTSEDIKKKYKTKSPFRNSSLWKQLLYILSRPSSPSAYSKEHRFCYNLSCASVHNVEFSKNIFVQEDYCDYDVDLSLPNTYINPLSENTVYCGNSRSNGGGINSAHDTDSSIDESEVVVTSSYQKIPQNILEDEFDLKAKTEELSPFGDHQYSENSKLSNEIIIKSCHDNNDNS